MTASGGLDVEHEADQLLIFSVTKDDGHKRHVEHPLLAHHSYKLLYDGQHWRFLSIDSLIAFNVSLRHIHKLGIGDADLVDRVGIVGSQRLLVAETRQQRVNLHLIGGQVKEALGVSHHTQQQCRHDYQISSHLQLKSNTFLSSIHPSRWSSIFTGPTPTGVPV